MRLINSCNDSQVYFKFFFIYLLADVPRGGPLAAGVQQSVASSLETRGIQPVQAYTKSTVRFAPQATDTIQTIMSQQQNPVGLLRERTRTQPSLLSHNGAGPVSGLSGPAPAASMGNGFGTTNGTAAFAKSNGAGVGADTRQEQRTQAAQAFEQALRAVVAPTILITPMAGRSGVNAAGRVASARAGGARSGTAGSRPLGVGRPPSAAGAAAPDLVATGKAVAMRR